MNPWFLGVGIIFAAGALFCGALGILGLQEKNVGKTFGQLKKVRGYRNTPGEYHTIIPHLSVYSYEYRVGEKIYYLSYNTKVKPRHIAERKPVYYLKCFPILAAADSYSGRSAWLMCAALSLGTAIILYCSFI